LPVLGLQCQCGGLRIAFIVRSQATRPLRSPLFAVCMPKARIVYILFDVGLWSFSKCSLDSCLASPFSLFFVSLEGEYDVSVSCNDILGSCYCIHLFNQFLAISILLTVCLFSWFESKLCGSSFDAAVSKKGGSCATCTLYHLCVGRGSIGS
jgi:hypothetical protein